MVGPDVRVIAGVDELSADSNRVRGALHASLKDKCNAKSLRDFTDVSRNAASVLLHAGATDHFQVRDLCQVGENLVLDAVGKECVFLVLAEICERKNRNTLLGRALALIL